MTGIAAVAGYGKSTDIVQKAMKDDWVIASTRGAVDRLTELFKKEKKDSLVEIHSIERANILLPKQINNLFIDEAN